MAGGLLAGLLSGAGNALGRDLEQRTQEREWVNRTMFTRNLEDQMLRNRELQREQFDSEQLLARQQAAEEQRRQATQIAAGIYGDLQGLGGDPNSYMDAKGKIDSGMLQLANMDRNVYGFMKDQYDRKMRQLSTPVYDTRGMFLNPKLNKMEVPGHYTDTATGQTVVAPSKFYAITKRTGDGDFVLSKDTQKTLNTAVNTLLSHAAAYRTLRNHGSGYMTSTLTASDSTGTATGYKGEITPADSARVASALNAEGDTISNMIKSHMGPNATAWLNDMWNQDYPNKPAHSWPTNPQAYLAKLTNDYKTRKGHLSGADFQLLLYQWAATYHLPIPADLTRIGENQGPSSDEEYMNSGEADDSNE